MTHVCFVSHCSSFLISPAEFSLAGSIQGWSASSGHNSQFKFALELNNSAKSNLCKNPGRNGALTFTAGKEQWGGSDVRPGNCRDSPGLIKFINHGRSHAIRRDREEFCLNFANNCGEAVQQKAQGLRAPLTSRKETGGCWDVYLDCPSFFRPRFVFIAQ